MDNQKILVVEDSIEAFNVFKRAIRGNFGIINAPTASDAFKILAQIPFDLIVLDIHLPDSDGFRIASVIRSTEQFEKIPIIFVTARSATSDMILALSSGGDDFISKPFIAEELNARIDAYLRKSSKNKCEAEIIRVGTLEINKGLGSAALLTDGQREELKLTRIEFKVLLYLAIHEGIEISRDQILDFVWGENTHVFLRSVDAHISKIRKALKSASPYLKSAHGRGYIFKPS